MKIIILIASLLIVGCSNQGKVIFLECEASQTLSLEIMIDEAKQEMIVDQIYTTDRMRGLICPNITITKEYYEGVCLDDTTPRYVRLNRYSLILDVMNDSSDLDTLSSTKCKVLEKQI